MKEVRLTIKKRAFPSQGRVRLNIAHLPDLGIHEGEHVDLVNEATKKTVTVTVIADTMVRVGHVRVSEEDLKTIGLNDDDDVIVKKTPPLQEKIKKAAADANKSFSKSVDKLDESVKKTSADVKASAEKAAKTVKKETKKASDKVGKVAAKTVKDVKKTVKKATGTHDQL
ncbi:MAG: hypothetical protein ACYDDV_02980 [Methanoregula sp.]